MRAQVARRDHSAPAVLAVTFLARLTCHGMEFLPARSPLRRHNEQGVGGAMRPRTGATLQISSLLISWKTR